MVKLEIEFVTLLAPFEDSLQLKRENPKIEAIESNEYSPIVSVLYERVPNMPEDSNRMTHYLCAEIYTKHIGRGEPTSIKTALSNKIRQRGKNGDDCGHIISSNLGGKMIDINLFPHEKVINRGWCGTGGLWKVGVEALMLTWLKNRFLKNPHVRFQIIFHYNDEIYPNRPDNFQMKIELIADDDDGNEENDLNDIKSRVCQELRMQITNTIAEEIKNGTSMKKMNKEEIENTVKRIKSNLEITQQLAKEILETLQPQPEPSFVFCPDAKPNCRTYFDWDSADLQKWKKEAIQLQEYHVKDNNSTEYFGFTHDDLDALELRILIALNGARIPQDATKGSPSSPFLLYTREERKSIRHLKKKIVNYSSDKILFNIIYVSTGSYSVIKGKNEFLASEEPSKINNKKILNIKMKFNYKSLDKFKVFVIKDKNNQRKFIDRDGRVYVDFADFKENNKLAKAAMIAPKDGTYTPPLSKKDEPVVLELSETPATTLLKRIGALTENVISVGGVVLSVTGVVTFFAPALLTATVASVVQYGSFILSGYSLLNTSKSIYDKLKHDESIHNEVFLLLSSALTFYSGSLKSTATQFAKEGKTYEDLLKKIGTVNEMLFKVSNLITILSSAAGIISSIYYLYHKRERTWQDYFQLSMSIFMLTNVLTKPMTLKGIFESEQMNHLEQLKKSLEKLKSDEAKTQMTDMLANHKSSDEKAYFIRNLNKIENPTEFFELIGKTSSSVVCTADGLSINNNIVISPLAYNEICRAVFNDKLNQLLKFNDLPKRVGAEFMNEIPPEKQEEFKKGLEKIKDLPKNEQKEATKTLINQHSGQNKTESFDSSWDNARNTLNETNKKSINCLIDELGTGANQSEDFESLKSLSEKKINDTITPEEEVQLNQQMEKCSKHRKEYFFSSSQGEYTNDAEKTAFKDKIKTFTNAKNERLCYRINIEDVKQNLIKFTGLTNFSDVENMLINEKKVFKDMKIQDFDRLNRVFEEYNKNTNGDYCRKLFNASLNLDKEDTFKGKINTTDDISSLAEAIHGENKKAAAIIEALNKDHPNQRTDPEKKVLETFISKFNTTIEKVEALDPNVKSQWSSQLTMAYHLKKHSKDFGKTEISAEQYFKDYPDSLFKMENQTGIYHSQQNGDIRRTFATRFGDRLHIGFTYGDEQHRASHFTKKNV